MKGIISLVCVLFLASEIFAQTPGPPGEAPWPNVNCDVPPPTPGDVVILPDPESCNSFYICAGLKPVKKYCPKNLHFNQNKRVCDWPRDAHCHLGYHVAN
ncbi:peritrophin-1 [Fopius arisanus]|uniref:Cht3_5 protein n=1 Tax=Fopius arisanus TaxID=64838 RepID=A0A0C9R7H3_9HYME|nr:PREDICTED: peritrophin-1 [Fopius arisanus]